jgi:sulfite exporter TauE/SafE
MVLTISPSVGGSGNHTWGEWAVLLPFTAGASASAAIVFGIVSAFGESVFGSAGSDGVTQSGLTVAIAILATAYGVSYLSKRPLPLKHTYRQVPKVWREAFSRRVAALLYGLGLGLGLFTKVPYVTFYVALALAFVSGSPAAGAVAGAVFGLARSAPLIVFRLSGVPLGAGERVTEGLARLRPRIDAINGLALSFGGVALLLAVL